jgi:hypothetical protein
MQIEDLQRRYVQYSMSRKDHDVNARLLKMLPAVATKVVSASTVNRTLGLQIFSLALSQLSYRGEFDILKGRTMTNIIKLVSILLLSGVFVLIRTGT